MTLVRRPGMKPLRDEIRDYLEKHPTAEIAGGIDIRESGNVDTRLELYKNWDEYPDAIWFYVDKTEELKSLFKEHHIDPAHVNRLLELYEDVCEKLALIKVLHEEKPARAEVVTVAERIKSMGIRAVTIHFGDEKETKMRLNSKLARGLVSEALLEEAKIIGGRPSSRGRPLEPHTEAISLMGEFAEALYPLMRSKEDVYDFIRSVLIFYGYPINQLEDAIDLIRKQLAKKWGN